MRHAVFIAPFAEFCDPRALVEVAVAAEENGWDAVFVWDHILRPTEETELIGDAWVSIAAMASATHRIRLGPMVTPITRRRPQHLARESVAVDLLSGGRLTVGLGLGVDSGGELSRFDEVVEYRGEHFTANGVSWAMHSFGPTTPRSDLMSVVSAGPPR